MNVFFDTWTIKYSFSCYFNMAVASDYRISPVAPPIEDETVSLIVDHRVFGRYSKVVIGTTTISLRVVIGF